MITPITATFPALNFPKEVDYPTQEDWAAFSAAAELNYGILSGAWSDKSEEFKEQTNNLAQEIRDIGENAINAITFDNIAQLILNSNIGRVDILGYYTKGDGGGGTFYWDSTSTESDNGGTIIQATGISTGRWKRVFSGSVNVKWFGAVGDGINDDTAMIEYVILNFKTIYIPNGVYKITRTLGSIDNINNQINYKNIYGDGSYNTIIKMVTSNDLDLIILGWYNKISDISFEQESTAIGGSKGTLRLQNTVFNEVPPSSLPNGFSYVNKLINCKFVGGQNYNIYGNGIAYTYIINCRVTRARGLLGNLYIEGTSTSLYITGGEYTGATTGSGVYLHTLGASNLTNVIAEGNKTSGFSLESCTNINMVSCYAENNYYANSINKEEINITNSSQIKLDSVFTYSFYTTNGIRSSGTTDSIAINIKSNTSNTLPNWSYNNSTYDPATFLIQGKLPGSTGSPGASLLLQNRVDNGSVLHETSIRLQNGTGNGKIWDIRSRAASAYGVNPDLFFETVPNDEGARVVSLILAHDNYIASPVTYNQTTADAANMVISSNGKMLRSTSSKKYKTGIEAVDKFYIDTFFDKARPIYYKSISDNDNANWGYWGFIAEEIAEFDKRLVHWRFDTKEIEVEKERVLEDETIEKYTEIETVNDESKPMIAEGVMYERIAVLLTAKVQEQQKIINDLISRISVLESKI